MERKKCNIKDINMIASLYNMFAIGYVGLDELDIYKEEDDYFTKIVVEDAKDGRKVLTCDRNKRADRIDGEYYFPVNGKQIPYHIMKQTDSLLLLVVGNEINIDKMSYIQPIDSNFIGHGPYGYGIEMICGAFRMVSASEVADIEFLTKSEKNDGQKIKKIGGLKR